MAESKTVSHFRAHSSKFVKFALLKFSCVTLCELRRPSAGRCEHESKGWYTARGSTLFAGDLSGVAH